MLTRIYLILEEVFTYRISVSLHHRIGCLLPKDSDTPKFCQNYKYDQQEQTQIRNQIFSNTLDTQILNTLQDVLQK